MSTQWRRRKKGTPNQIGKAFPVGRQPYMRRQNTRFGKPRGIKYRMPTPHSERRQAIEEFNELKTVLPSDVGPEVRDAIDEDRPTIVIVESKENKENKEPELMVVDSGEEEEEEPEPEQAPKKAGKPGIRDMIGEISDKVGKAFHNMRMAFERE